MTDLQRLKSLRSGAAVRDFIGSKFSGDVERFIDALDETLNKLLRSDIKRAERFATQTLAFAVHLPPEWNARLISQQARVALWRGDYQGAKEQYSEALVQFQKHRNFAAAARLRKGLVEVLMYLGQYSEAIVAGRQALRYFRRKGLKNDEAQLLTNLGNVYHRCDRNHLALQYYTKARKIFAPKGGIPLAIVDFNRANIFANLNKLQQAKRLYLEAASIYKSAGLEIAHAQAHYSVAYLSFLESKYAEALEGFERVYDSFIRLGDGKSAAITLLDLVELEVHLHLFGSAIYLGRQVVVDLGAFGLSYEQGKACYFVATALVELGEAAEARKYLRRAHGIFEEEENDLWLGMVVLARARLNLKLGKISEATRVTRKARTHFVRSGDKRRANDALLLQVEALSKAATTSTDFEASVRELRQSNLVRYQQYALANVLGDYHLRRGDNLKAVHELKRALQVAEEMLGGLNQDEIRVLFAADVTESYNRLAQAYVGENKQRKALIEVLRGMAVLNLQSRMSHSTKLPRNIQEQVDALRTQIARLQRVGQPGQRALATADYRDLEQRLWRLQRKARISGKVRHDTAAVSSREVESVLENLGNKTLVHYHSWGDDLGVFVAGQSQVEHFQLSVTQDEFQRVLRKSYFLLEQGMISRTGSYPHLHALDHYRKLLHSYLIAPIAHRLEQSELVLAVDREFLQVPFTTLISESGRCLQDDFDLTIIVNPLDLKKRKLRWDSGKSSTIIGSDSDSLPLVRRECKTIHAIYSAAREISGDLASTNEVRRALRLSEGFVHIAAHAARASENPLFSRILMADGPLFPFELTGQVKAQLVTLSGCQTAAPGLYYGNSLSLAKAFYQAGGRAVLASLWSVADDVTLEFMSEFYEHLYKSKSIKNSYQRAVKKVRELTGNPAHWGAFVLLGAVT